MSKTTSIIPFERVKQQAYDIAQDLYPSCMDIQVVGSIRREVEIAHDIDILVIPHYACIEGLFGPTEQTRSILEEDLPTLKRKWQAVKICEGPKKKKYQLPNDITLEICISNPATWALELVLKTGPEDFTKRCVTQKRKGGYLPSDCVVKDGWLIYRIGNDRPLGFCHEIEILNFLGLGWIEPRDRR
jgi:DNA polymerase/3'-5' exonuclease PolX